MTADNHDVRADVVPQDGRVVLVLIDSGERAVWWRTDGDLDRLATADGEVLSWTTVDRCRRHARTAVRTLTAAG